MTRLFSVAVVLAVASVASAQPHPVRVVIATPPGAIVDAETKAVHAEVVKAFGEQKYASLFRLADDAQLTVEVVGSATTQESRTTDVLERGLGGWRTRPKTSTVTLHETTLRLVVGDASKAFSGKSTWSPAQAHARAVAAVAEWARANGDLLRVPD